MLTVGPRRATGLAGWILAWACACPLLAQAGLSPSELMRWDERARREPDVVTRELAPQLSPLPLGDAATLEGWRILGEAHGRLDDLAAAARVRQHLSAAAQQLGDPVARRRVDILVQCLEAGQLLVTGPLGRADGLLEAALPELDAQAPSALRQTCLHTHALVKEGQGRYGDALRLLQAALREADAHGPSWNRSEFRSTMANVLRRAGQRSAARELNAQALRLASEADDPLTWSRALNVQSMLAEGPDQREQEWAALQGALAQARRAKAPFDEAQALANLSDHYLLQGEFSRALATADQALPLSIKTRNHSAEGVARVNAGLALISMYRKDEGLKRVQVSVDRDLAADDLASAIDSLADLGFYLERAGYLVDAVGAYQRHRRLADEVARRSRQRDVLTLQEEIEADRRRQASVLLSQDNALKEAQLQQRALSDRFWLLANAAAGTLAALAAWLYHRSRVTQAALQASTRRLHAESQHDPLTGLANRRQFPGSRPRGGGEGGATGSLCLIDLDHFKQINDRHGHAAGDLVLIEVARRLRAASRESDLVLRWGGEEFLVLVSGELPEQLDQWVERLLVTLSGEPVWVDGRAIALTGSIGFARFPLSGCPEGLPWSLAVDLVDAAMRLAKGAGRHQACGVQAVAVSDLGELRQMTGQLAQARHDGRAQLRWIQGPQRGADA